ncbi:hypothetical protein E4U42_004294 [Claviceps africana]|uniref:Uncharacterized protein n=1 Tax=Claviceps africana TaxID=83212 RepID=A0A8K0J882_9HYPO|nr:hypothetical protein E4U42_004294 [Claviceps africana]
MQFLTLLIATASVALAVPAAPQATGQAGKGDGLPHWCNGGSPGDNTCEKKGLNTYCCSFNKHGEYIYWRGVQMQSTNGQKDKDGHPIWTCDTDKDGFGGLTYCA